MKFCDQCGLADCAWIAGATCEGQARIKARQTIAPIFRDPWPLGTHWLARLISAKLVELEAQNHMLNHIVQGKVQDVQLVDVNVRQDEFQMLLQSGIGGVITSWMLQAIQGIGAKAYVEVMGQHPKEGKVVFTIARMGGEPPGQRAARYESLIRGFMTPRPYAQWHEDLGPCLWWHFSESGKVTEPPYVGTPLDTSWPRYHNYFTRIPVASLDWKPPAPDSIS